MYLKLGTRKQLLSPPPPTHTHKNGHPLLLLPRHFLPFPLPPSFFQAETFACRVAGGCQTANNCAFWGAAEGRGGNGRQPKSMRNVHAAKSPNFHHGVGWAGQGAPSATGRGGQRGGGGEGGGGSWGRPGHCKVVSHLKAGREIPRAESVRLAFVRGARPGVGGAWRPRRLRGSRRPSSSPRRRWAAPRSSSAARSRRTARPPRLCFWPTSP